MKLDSYKNDPQFLTERYRVSVKNLNPLLESFDLKDPYYTYWAKEVHPLLIEVALDTKQIDALFKSIEQGATAAGDNRTMLGKAKDTAGEISDKVKDVWFNKLGGALQQSGPVKAFDEKYEEIKAKVAAENPELAAALSKYKQFADNNPKLQKFLLMIAASTAGALGLAVAGGAAAGIAATGLGVGAGVAIVNIADRLLKGEKASTAIGRGGTAGIVAGLTAAGVKAAGDLISAGAEMIKSEENVLYWGDKAFNITPEDGERLRDAFKAYTDASPSGNPAELMGAINSPESAEYFGLVRELANKAVNDPEYIQAAFDSAVGIASKNFSINDMVVGAQSVLQAVTPVAAAAAGQTAGAAGEKKQPTPTEALVYNLRPLTEAQCAYIFGKIAQTNHRMITEGEIWEQGEEPEGQKPSLMQKVMGKAGEIGKNLTTKVTASKLMGAWKKAGSPTDSDALADFIKQQGVNDQVVAQVYQGMQLPAPGTAKATADIAAIKKEIAMLGPKSAKQLAGLLSKQLGAA